MICVFAGCGNFAITKVPGMCGKHDGRWGMKVPPFVYAVQFPDLDILKIGKSTAAWGPIQTAVTALNKKGISAPGAVEIWRKDGSYREEQFMHAYFAYYYLPAFDTGTRQSEWYKVPGVSNDSLICRLDDVWAMRPADLTLIASGEIESLAA